MGLFGSFVLSSRPASRPKEEEGSSEILRQLQAVPAELQTLRSEAQKTL